MWLQGVAHRLVRVVKGCGSQVSSCGVTHRLVGVAHRLVGVRG